MFFLFKWIIHFKTNKYNAPGLDYFCSNLVKFVNLFSVIYSIYDGYCTIKSYWKYSFPMLGNDEYLST